MGDTEGVSASSLSRNVAHFVGPRNVSCELKPSQRSVQHPGQTVSLDELTLHLSHVCPVRASALAFFIDILDGLEA